MKSHLHSVLGTAVLSLAIAACSTTSTTDSGTRPNANRSARADAPMNADNPASVVNNNGNFYHFRDAKEFEAAQQPEILNRAQATDR